MRTYLILFGIAFTTLSVQGHSGILPDIALPADSIIKKQNHSPLYLSLELQLGSSFLTNTALSANRPLTSGKTMSGSFFTSILIPLAKKENAASSHFAAHIGVGTTIQTFGLNKIIEQVNNISSFVDFPTKDIRYSYLQQLYIAVPIGFSYRPLLNKNLELEIGGIAGYLLYKEHTFYTAATHGYSIQSTEDIHNLNPFQYGVRGKINLIRAKAKCPIGCMYSISGNYYFSELFKSVNHTPTNNFSILIGIGFLIHH